MNVEVHLKNIGDLAHFYKTNLSTSYPNMPNNYEQNEWIDFSNWLKPIYPNNNEEKAELFLNSVLESKKAISKYKKGGNFLQFKKHDYFQYFPKDLKNTTEFV